MQTTLELQKLCPLSQKLILNKLIQDATPVPVTSSTPMRKKEKPAFDLVETKNSAIDIVETKNSDTSIDIVETKNSDTSIDIVESKTSAIDIVETKNSDTSKELLQIYTRKITQRKGQYIGEN